MYATMMTRYDYHYPATLNDLHRAPLGGYTSKPRGTVNRGEYFNESAAVPSFSKGV
jgi:hypothetical protein